MMRALYISAMAPCNAEQAATRCPFLRELATAEGPSFALHIAKHPLKPFRAGPVLEEGEDFAATFALFHGPRGVVPLQRAAGIVTTTSTSSLDERIRCSAASSSSSRPPMPCSAAASISLSGFGFLVSNTELHCTSPRHPPRASYRHSSRLLKDH